MEYYEQADGTRPAEEFILAQDKKMQAKLFLVLEFLEERGPALREPYSKPLGDGIFEVRAKQGTDISRVLYFFVVGRKIILTNRPRHGRLTEPSVTGRIIKAGRRIDYG